MGKRLTSGYTLVVHETTTSSVKLWLGALAPSIAKPHHWRLVVKRSNTAKQRQQEKGTEVLSVVYGDDWQRPFDALQKRFYSVKTLEGLKPNTHYIVEFQARSCQQWKLLEKAFFTTLPNALPAADKKPFTVGIGSCFYKSHDDGSVGQAYEALYNHEDLRPDIKFLAGDQVYVDIGLGWYPLDESDCQERVADHYRDSWEQLRSILRRGGSWMISDDHEFWNNYPFFDGFNPYLITLDKHKSFRKRWEKSAQIGVRTIQQGQPVRTFNIGDDLSFCVADLRMERSKKGFLSAASHKQLISWVKHLSCPGVLVIPQPLMAGKGDKHDKNLPDWSQYDLLLSAIEKGNHDIVVLTGDVHYGQVNQVLVGSSNNKLTEVITSPLSNLSELNGVAAATPPEIAETLFPMVSANGMKKNPINSLGKVTTESQWWDLRYPVARTHEHFMTVEFTKTNGKLKMKINAWHARQLVKRTGLPKKIKGFNIKPIELT